MLNLGLNWLHIVLLITITQNSVWCAELSQFSGMVSEYGFRYAWGVRLIPQRNHDKGEPA